MPTGRCLSWLKFSSSVLSIAMSLSGEYLCVAQADKEGIYMYVDRSLYETVHFWKEPKHPSDIMESLVKIDSELFASSGDTTEEIGDIEHDKTSELTRDEHQNSEKVLRESTTPRSEGAITLSTLPKAYWSNLFRLEEIKQRNKPKAPPSAPVAAPFFLPTVVRDGAQTSFPTPDEFAKIQNDSESHKSQSGKRKIEHSNEEDISGLRAVWSDNSDDEDDGNDVDEVDVQPTKVTKLSSMSRVSKKFQDLPRYIFINIILKDRIIF